MDTISEIRFKHLMLLVEEAGSQANFADVIGLEPAQISSLVNRRRNIGEKLARKIEKALNLPNAYLDHSDSVSEQGGHTIDFRLLKINRLLNENIICDADVNAIMVLIDRIVAASHSLDNSTGLSKNDAENALKY